MLNKSPLENARNIGEAGPSYVEPTPGHLVFNVAGVEFRSSGYKTSVSEELEEGCLFSKGCSYSRSCCNTTRGLTPEAGSDTQQRLLFGSL